MPWLRAGAVSPRTPDQDYRKQPDRFAPIAANARLGSSTNPLCLTSAKLRTHVVGITPQLHGLAYQSMLGNAVCIFGEESLELLARHRLVEEVALRHIATQAT